MKRQILLLMIAVITFQLCGCAGWNANEYISVADHLT